MLHYLFTIIGFASWAGLFAQYSNIKINTSSSFPVEPSVAINPNNPLEVAVGAVLGRGWDVAGMSLGRCWDVAGMLLGCCWDVAGMSLELS